MIKVFHTSVKRNQVFSSPCRSGKRGGIPKSANQLAAKCQGILLASKTKSQLIWELKERRRKMQREITGIGMWRKASNEDKRRRWQSSWKKGEDRATDFERQRAAGRRVLGYHA